MVDMDFTFPVRPMRGPVILTEWESTKPFGFETASSYPNFRECTMDVDESVLMLYCTDSNHDPTLSVWDFRVDRKYDRYYERIQVGNQQCFVCYEDILETS
jgi:hypothetical protein